MKAENKVALKTLAIKATIANTIRTDLYKKRLDQISDKEKIELFDKWFAINHTSHWLLNSYKAKRKYKKEIHEARVARGYKFKKRQTKEEREKYLAGSK